MPWNETSPMDQKTQFIADCLRETFNVTELCGMYKVSRTAYKWIDRYSAARVSRPLRGALRQRQRRRALEGCWLCVSIVCVGEYVGFEEIDDGLWIVYFGPVKLGRFNERNMRIEDEFGRLKRHNV